MRKAGGGELRAGMFLTAVELMLIAEEMDDTEGVLE